VKHLLDIEIGDRPDQWPGGAFYRHQSEWSTAASTATREVHPPCGQWENILYFLYPYFWGSDDLGRQLLFDPPIRCTATSCERDTRAS
jgi:hypothetical protein